MDTSVLVHLKGLYKLECNNNGEIYSFRFSVPIKEIDQEIGKSGYIKMYVNSKKNPKEINHIFNQLQDLLNDPFKINPQIQIYFKYNKTQNIYQVSNIILSNEKPMKKSYIEFITKLFYPVV